MTSVTGCQVTLSTVLIPQLLAAAFSLADSCVNEVKFSDGSYIISGSPINQWLWNFGDGGTSVQQSPAHPYSVSGVYTVQLVVINEIGCSDTIIKNITVHEKPAASLVPDINYGCEPLTVNFSNTSASADGDITAWQWNFGNNNTSSIENPSAIFAAGTYTVSLAITTAFGCMDTAKYIALIHAHPSAIADFKITPEKASDFVPFIFFIDKSQNAHSWFWDFGDGSTSTETNPVHTYSPGYFTLIQIVTSQYGCSDTMEKNLEYVSEYAYYFPGAFSPNGDGKNDVFKSESMGIKDFKLSVYNRYGQMIYATNNKNESWDGTYKNNPVPAGAYLYKAKIVDRKNKFHIHEGHVVVIR